MNGCDESGDVSDRHCFMNIHTLSEAHNCNSVYSTKKRYGKFLNVSKMEDTVLQDGVDIDAMLSASTPHQYANMEYNNDYNQTLTNGKISTSKISSVSTLTPPYDNPRNDEVCSLKNPIHDNIKYLDLSKTQARADCQASGVMKKQIKLLAHRTWNSMIIEYLPKDKL